jgi:plastocyanin
VLALLLAIAGAFWGASLEPAAAQDAVTIPAGDFWFCDASFEEGVCDTEVTAGDTVVWDFSSAFVVHTTTECGASCDNPTDTPLWDSGVIDAGGTFQYTFDQPGTYLYYCEIHASQQRGRIIVRAAEPTATPQTPIEDGTPGGAAPTATPGPGLPGTGYGPSGGSSDGWTLATLASAGLALVALAAGLHMIPKAR